MVSKEREHIVVAATRIHNGIMFPLESTQSSWVCFLLGLIDREGIIVPWKVGGYLSYNIVRGEKVDSVLSWLWHECRKLGSLPTKILR